MSEPSHSADDGGGIRTRTVEIVVAVFILALGALVVFDSVRMGARWGDDGPQSGYFPFYVGLLLCIASVVTLVQAWRRNGGDDLFVTWQPLRRVLTVLVPAVVYVLAVQLVGIYVASAVYIAVFMAWLGHYGWLRSAAVGVGVNAVLFLMFEVWFKVPLYKGVLEPLRFLGY